MKSKRRVREPGPLPLPNEKPLWPSFCLSNTSRALHSLSPCLVPSLQGRPFLLKSQIKGYPFREVFPGHLTPVPMFSITTPLHSLQWPIPLWDYVLISLSSVRSVPLLLKIYPHCLAQCLAHGIHPTEMCSMNTYTLQAAYLREAG